MPLNRAALNPRGEYVLYWMTMARRTAYNFALERAVAEARRLDRPLVVLEPLRLDYPWASPRLHAFILQGMAANRRALAGRRVLYHPYLETRPGQARGLLQALAARACLVVGDYYPCFFLPRMLAAAAWRCAWRPWTAAGSRPWPPPSATTPRPTPSVATCRRPCRSTWRPCPPPTPWTGRICPAPRPRPRPWRPARSSWPAWAWPATCPRRPATWRASCGPRPGPLPSGPLPAGAGLHQRAEPLPALRPHLAPTGLPGAGPGRGLVAPAPGAQGWWGMSPGAEAFLDQLVTWRELGFNICQHRPDYGQSLPAWARATLAAHVGDPRPWLYSLEDLAAACTHDPVWNAAQGQLAAKGVMPGYLRMLWGKKILEWSESPQVACAAMIELNNRYALDGRDPNTYSGIFWVLGRYDRPFGQRAVFGQVRYMSSDSARRKLRLGPYLAAHA